MIDTAAGLAILCLLCAGILDLVFKLYAAVPRSRGMLIFGVGIVWGALQLGYVIYTDATTSFDSVTLSWGLAAAICVTVSNLLLLECMGHLPISMASTIYRLNTVPLVVFAFLFLGEDIDLVRSAGIALGIVTVLVLYTPGLQGSDRAKLSGVFFALIIVASVIRALYGTFTKAGVNAGADPDAMILLSLIHI